MNLDGLADPTLEALFEIYVSKPGGIIQCKAIVNNLEPFLKKIIFITTNVDVTKDRSKNLAACLKDLNLLKRGANGPMLDEASLPSYKGRPGFLEQICRVYVERNKIHSSAHRTAAEIYQVLESTLVVYIYAVLQHYNDLNRIVGVVVTEQAQVENYKAYINSALSYNLSLKMLEADFGVKISALDDFEVKIKAKAKRRKEERDEYLKDFNQYTMLPLKFLPEIEGVINNSKFILLHGIATSGKSKRSVG